MKTETMRPAKMGDTFSVRGEVVRMARQVAYAEATSKDADGRIVSRCTAPSSCIATPEARRPGRRGCVA